MVWQCRLPAVVAIVLLGILDQVTTVTICEGVLAWFVEELSYVSVLVDSTSDNLGKIWLISLPTQGR